MTIKILIVEDEPLSAEATEKLVSLWEKDSEIRSARTALQFEMIAKEWDPDIILLDIRIPGGDSLTILKSLRDEGNKSEIIITSAFDIFPYAKTAMELGVASFLVKPVRTSQLFESLNKVKNKLNSLNLHQEQLAKAKDYLRKNRGPIARNILMNIIKNTTITDEIQSLSEEIGLPPAVESHLFSIIALPSEENKLVWGQISLLEDIEKYLGKDSIIFQWKNYYTLIFIPSSSLRASPDTISVRLIEIMSDNQLQGNVIYGGQISSLEGITDMISEIETSLEESVLGGFGQFIWGKEKSSRIEPSSDDNFPFLFEMIKSKICESIRDNQKTLLQKGLEDLKSISSTTLFNDLEIGKLLFLGIMGQIAQILIEHNCYYSELRAWGRKYTIDMLSSTNSFNLLAITEFAMQEAFSMRTRSIQTSSSVIHDALNFIEMNYENISLEMTAQRVHVTPEHLSRLFQKVLKKRFVDIIRDIRIEKAKALLKEGMSVRDVAISVGYGNISYFSTLFKQQTGFNPSSYRSSTS